MDTVLSTITEALQKKSVALAIVLGFLFGPLGLFYTSAVAGVFLLLAYLVVLNLGDGIYLGIQWLGDTSLFSSLDAGLGGAICCAAMNGVLASDLKEKE